MLLDSGADVELAGSEARRTALMEAARFRHAQCVSLLANHTADINATNKYAETALICAVQGQCLSLSLSVFRRLALSSFSLFCLSLFLSLSLSLSFFISLSLSPSLTLCLSLSSEDSLSCSFSSSLSLCSLSLCFILCFFLPVFCFLTCQCFSGSGSYIWGTFIVITATIACHELDVVVSLSPGGDVECVRILLDAGAGVNLQAEDGSTALYRAVEKQLPEVITALLERDCDPNIATGTRLIVFRNQTLVGRGWVVSQCSASALYRAVKNSCQRALLCFDWNVTQVEVKPMHRCLHLQKMP